MSENITPTSADQSAQDRKRRRKALLAGGLVLGLGAAATLAAFSDSEFAQGVFGTGEFNLVGSTETTGFVDHDENAPASLTFVQNADNMTPGDTVTESYFLQLDDDTTLDGTLVGVDPVISSDDLGEYLEPSVKYFELAGGETEPADCSGTGTTELELDAAAGNIIQACLTVNLNATQAQIAALGDETDGTILWQWTATSA